MQDSGFDLLGMMGVVIPDKVEGRREGRREGCVVIAPRVRANGTTKPAQNKPVEKPKTESKYTFKNPALMTTNELAEMTPEMKKEFLQFLRNYKHETPKEERYVQAPKPGYWCDSCLSELLARRREELLRQQAQMDKDAVQKQLDADRKALERELARQLEARENAIKNRKEGEAEAEARRIAREAERQKEIEEERENAKKLSERDKELAEARRKAMENNRKDIEEQLKLKLQRLEAEKEAERKADAASKGLNIDGLNISPEEIERIRRETQQQLEKQIAEEKANRASQRLKEIEEDRLNNRINQAALEEAQRRADAAKRALTEALTNSWNEAINGKKTKADEEREAARRDYLNTLARNAALAQKEADELKARQQSQMQNLAKGLEEQEQQKAIDRELAKFLERASGNRLFDSIQRRHGPTCSCAICARCGKVVPVGAINKVSAKQIEEIAGPQELKRERDLYSPYIEGGESGNV